MKTVHLVEVRVTARYVVMEDGVIIAEQEGGGPIRASKLGIPGLTAEFGTRMAEIEAQIAAAANTADSVSTQETLQ